MRQKILTLVALSLSCFPSHSFKYIPPSSASGSSSGSSSGGGSEAPVITSLVVDVAGNAFTVTGTARSAATSALLSGGGLASSVVLAIRPGATATVLVAYATSSLNLVANTTYDFSL